MTYRQLQAELKALKANGHSVPKLNSKKEVLQAAYDEIMTPSLPIVEQIIESMVAEMLGLPTEFGF